MNKILINIILCLVLTSCSYYNHYKVYKDANYFISPEIKNNWYKADLAPNNSHRISGSYYRENQIVYNDDEAYSNSIIVECLNKTGDAGEQYNDNSKQFPLDAINELEWAKGFFYLSRPPTYPNNFAYIQINNCLITLNTNYKYIFNNELTYLKSILK